VGSSSQSKSPSKQARAKLIGFASAVIDGVVLRDTSVVFFGAARFVILGLQQLQDCSLQEDSVSPSLQCQKLRPTNREPDRTKVLCVFSSLNQRFSRLWHHDVTAGF
jgi:hypothetical protein